MMLTRTSSAAALLAALLLICGCAPTAGELAPSTPPASTPTHAPTGTTTPTPACGTEDAGGALAEAVRRLPAPFDEPDLADVRWAVQDGDETGYDSCAALSWVVVTIEEGTVSSPAQVALFHHHDLIGPATERAYAYRPQVTRISDTEIDVAYRFALEGEDNASASGRAVSRFSWDTQTGTVHRTGELPPTP